MFSLFGCLGQIATNKFTAPREISVDSKPGFWRRMSEKSYSPVTVLSNEEYAEMLQEKLLRVEAEIAVIDDKIAALKKQERDADVEDSRGWISLGE